MKRQKGLSATQDLFVVVLCAATEFARAADYPLKVVLVNKVEMTGEVSSLLNGANGGW